MPVSEIQPLDLPEQIRAFVAERLSQYPTTRALLIPTLMECQKYYGYISPEAANAVGKLLNVPYGEVQSCVSFYTMLFTQPTGKYIFGVCRTPNCDLEGALDFVHHFEEHYKTPLGEPTPDGMFTMYEVECLCDCHNAPSIQVIKSGKEFQVWWLNNVNQELLDKVMGELKAGQEDALRERLVRVDVKQHAPDDRRWVWLVTTNNHYPVWVEAKDGEYIPHDGFGKLDTLKQDNPKLWAEVQAALKN